ncbi:VOC family protein [Ruegeria sp. ANG10]|uniref:VOC family protein n=1 Tax=Ruegeria sp. ANG10 TaxID=3042467 RepID=UPI003455D312
MRRKGPNRPISKICRAGSPVAGWAGPLQFDDTTYFVQEATDELKKSELALYLYVPDLDAAYQRALNAGAISIAEPAEQYHGDSLAILADKWGNQWYLAYATVTLDDDQVRERRQAEEAKDN